MNFIYVFYGYIWNYISKCKCDDGIFEEYEDEEVEQCFGMVEVDLLEIGGQFFDVNGMVLEVDKLEFYEFMGSGVLLEDVFEVLRVYELSYEVDDQCGGDNMLLLIFELNIFQVEIMYVFK